MLINQSTVDRWKQEAEAYKPSRASLRMRNRPRPNARKKRRQRYWDDLAMEENRQADEEFLQDQKDSWAAEEDEDRERQEYEYERERDYIEMERERLEDEIAALYRW